MVLCFLYDLGVRFLMLCSVVYIPGMGSLHTCIDNIIEITVVIILSYQYNHNKSNATTVVQRRGPQATKSERSCKAILDISTIIPCLQVGEGQERRRPVLFRPEEQWGVESHRVVHRR